MEENNSINLPEISENTDPSAPVPPCDLSLFEFFRASSTPVGPDSPTDRVLSHPRHSVWNL